MLSANLHANRGQVLGGTDWKPENLSGEPVEKEIQSNCKEVNPVEFLDATKNNIGVAKRASQFSKGPVAKEETMGSFEEETVMNRGILTEESPIGKLTLKSVGVSIFLN